MFTDEKSQNFRLTSGSWNKNYWKCNRILLKHIYLESLGNDKRKYMHTRIGTVKATHFPVK